MSACTMEKIAVFAPMASARVRITVTVKPGLRRNWRAANLRFCLKASIDDPLGETAGISTGDTVSYTFSYVDGPEKVRFPDQAEENEFTQARRATHNSCCGWHLRTSLQTAFAVRSRHSAA